MRPAPRIAWIERSTSGKSSSINRRTSDPGLTTGSLGVARGRVDALGGAGGQEMPGPWPKNSGGGSAHAPTPSTYRSVIERLKAEDEGRKASGYQSEPERNSPGRVPPRNKAEINEWWVPGWLSKRMCVCICVCACVCGGRRTIGEW